MNQNQNQPETDEDFINSLLEDPFKNSKDKNPLDKKERKLDDKV